MPASPKLVERAFRVQSAVYGSDPAAGSIMDMKLVGSGVPETE